MFRALEPTGIEIAFMACAIGGGLFFLLRVVLIMVGGFGAEDFDVDGGDLDADLDVQDGHATEVAFKFLSFNTIGAFFMMFGFSGLTSYVEFGLGYTASLLLALFVGLMVMFLTAWFFKQIMKLQSPGDTFRVQSIVGKTAEVYQRIPSSGHGKIHITVNGQLRELDAKSEGDYKIDSFKKVIVTDFVGPSEVVVQPAPTGADKNT